MNIWELAPEQIVEKANSEGENRQVEYKGADKVDLNNKQLKQFLAEYVSAFANTEGGYLVLGVGQERNDAPFHLDPIDRLKGRQAKRDFLSQLITDCVRPEFNDYDVHEVPCDADKSIYVVHVSQCQNTPIQTAETREYFWRRDDSVERAPQFHIDNIYRRKTSSTLMITAVSHTVDMFVDCRGIDDNDNALSFRFDVTIKNKSLSAATCWGVLFSPDDKSGIWRVQKDLICDDHCFHAKTEHPLLPSASQTITLDLRLSAGDDKSIEEIKEIWKSSRITLQAVSQDHVGDRVFYPDFSNEDVWQHESNRISNRKEHWDQFPDRAAKMVEDARKKFGFGF